MVAALSPVAIRNARVEPPAAAMPFSSSSVSGAFGTGGLLTPMT
jgi:hypothetical protein